MYSLKRFYGPRFVRMNAIVDALEGRIGSYVDLIGAATLPLPEVCQAQGLPGLVCGVEGHRDSRLFPATEPMDEAEALTEERVRLLFGLDAAYHVTAQPHSATQANQVAFRAVLGDDGGRVAGFAPNDGGHISHRLGIPPSSEFVSFPMSEAASITRRSMRSSAGPARQLSWPAGRASHGESTFGGCARSRTRSGLIFTRT